MPEEGSCTYYAINHTSTGYVASLGGGTNSKFIIMLYTVLYSLLLLYISLFIVILNVIQKSYTVLYRSHTQCYTIVVIRNCV